MYRILVLILASDDQECYKEMQNLWRVVMSFNREIPFLFYKSDPNLETDVELRNDTLYVKCVENFESVYEKTYKTFQYLYDKLDNFDFVLRTNLSSFYYFPYYLKAIQDFPKQNCCAAVRGGDEVSWFPSGAGMTLSTDIIKRIVDENPQFECQDDVTIGIALRKWGIPLIVMDRFDVFLPQEIEKIDKANETQFHFRLKNIFDNRELDIELFKYLIHIYYLSS